MLEHRRTGEAWIALSLALVVHAAWPRPLLGQVDVPIRAHSVIIPPDNVLSVRTDRIRAQAQYLQAMGDFLESVGLARIYDTQADQMEIRNHAEWVRTYFDLKDLNKAYYLREHPPFLDRQQRIQQELKRRHLDNPHLDLEGEVSEQTLNWFLQELSGPLLAAQALRGDAPGAFADETLDLNDNHRILLTDGSSAAGRKLVFRADEAKVLQTPWPFALRGPEFEALRQAFELARQNAVRETNAAGQITYDTQVALKKAVDELRIALERHYPRQRRLEARVWEDYARAKRFLQALALSVDRALDINDRQVFDESLRFQGNRVSELIVHMARRGLEFAPLAAGSEGVYRKLYLAVRNIYLDIHPENH